MKVKEMIELLREFDPEMTIVIRRGDEDGCFCDYVPHKPREFFPGGQVCLSAFEQVKSRDIEKR